MRELIVLGLLVFAFGWGMLARKASAQIFVRIDSGTEVSYPLGTTSITLTSNDVPSSATQVRLRVSPTSANLPSLTLSGVSPATGLDVLVTIENSLVGRQAFEALNIGGNDWPGLTLTGMSDADRAKVRVAAALGGDLTGGIACGTVFRVQTAGDIAGPIVASAYATGAFTAINYVVAGGQITAASAVEAAGSSPRSDSVRADINVVQAAGIHASILAPCGSVGAIQSRRDITLGSNDKFLARWGIDTLLAADFTVTPAVYYDIDGTVVTNFDADGPASESALHYLGARSFNGNLSCGDLGKDGPVFAMNSALNGTMHVRGNVVRTAVIGVSDSTASSLIIEGDLIDQLAFVGSSTFGSLVISGNVLSEISAPDTDFGEVTFPNGFGSLEHFASLTANSIGSFTVNGNVYASYIGADLVGVGGTDFGEFVVNGDYYGSLDVGSFDRFEVGGDIVTGDSSQPPAFVSFEALPADRTIRIGGALRDLNNYAFLVIKDASGEPGLSGQVVINAGSASSQTPHWVGAVQVNGGNGPYVLIDANDPPDNAPLYGRTSEELGGGAVGEVPFHLHTKDCIPAATSSLASRTFLNSAFCHVPPGSNLCPGDDPGEPYSEASIDLAFYGPVKAESATERPYEIGTDLGSGPDFSVDYGQWTTFDIKARSSVGAKRSLVISGGEQVKLPAGVYYIRPKRTGAARLLCDCLFPGAPSTPVADFLYEFRLLKDCNTNGLDDADEPAQSFCCLDLCDPDYDRDGNVDQADIAYLVNVVAGGYNWSGRDPDFTQDGNVDQGDVDALTNTIAGGGCP